MNAHLTEANRIKERLRKADTAKKVYAVAKEERPIVQGMIEQGGEARTMAVQISNLKAYRLEQIQRAQNER